MLSSTLIQGAFGGGGTLDRGVVVDRSGFLESGPYDRSTDLADRDWTLSVDFVNHGTVGGAIRFYIGDDTYDGRDGSVGGIVFGKGGNDTLLGGAGAERLEGGYGDDVLAGGFGNHRIDGGAGSDTIRFATPGQGMSIRFDGGTLIANGPEGRDVVTGAERLSFADRVVDTNVAASVGYLYQDYMGRAATGAELVYWNGAI